MGGVATGLETGSWELAIVGGVIGGVSGLISGSSASREAERQKELLEYQYKMTQYLEEMNKNIAGQNKYYEELASNSSKIGINMAKKSALTNIVNSKSDTLGGSATAAWNDRKWHGGLNRGWEYNWITTQASFDLSDFGLVS